MQTRPAQRPPLPSDLKGGGGDDGGDRDRQEMGVKVGGGDA